MIQEKPKIRKYILCRSFEPIYVCSGTRFSAIGKTPYDAYCQWLVLKWHRKSTNWKNMEWGT